MIDQTFQLMKGWEPAQQMIFGLVVLFIASTLCVLFGLWLIKLFSMWLEAKAKRPPAPLVTTPLTNLGPNWKDEMTAMLKEQEAFAIELQKADGLAALAADNKA